MNEQETRGERITYFSTNERLVRTDLDAAILRERAALEQASRARESTAAMAERLQATEARIEELGLLLIEAEARAAELERRLFELGLEGSEFKQRLEFERDSARLAFEQKEKDSFFLAAEVKQWQAHAARLETELKRIRNEADEASGRNDDCVDFACGLSKDIDSIFSAAPAAWRKEEQ